MEESVIASVLEIIKFVIKIHAGDEGRGRFLSLMLHIM